MTVVLPFVGELLDQLLPRPLRVVLPFVGELLDQLLPCPLRVVLPFVGELLDQLLPRPLRVVLPFVGELFDQLLSRPLHVVLPFVAELLDQLLPRPLHQQRARHLALDVFHKLASLCVLRVVDGLRHLHRVPRHPPLQLVQTVLHPGGRRDNPLRQPQKHADSPRDR